MMPLPLCGWRWDALLAGAYRRVAEVLPVGFYPLPGGRFAAITGALCDIPGVVPLSARRLIATTRWRCAQ